MSISAALRTWLEEDADVRQAVDGRIYPDKLPQGSDFPQLTYEQHSESTLKSLSGLSGQANPVFAVRAWGLSKADAKGLAELIRGNRTSPKLDGFRGLVKCDDGSQVRLQCVRLLDSTDEFIAPAHGDDVGTYCTTALYRLTYEDV